jgi:hypothetical protein
MMSKLELNKKVELEIIDKSLTHIKKVEANPDIEFEDVDTFDAWYTYNDETDFNVHESNFGMKEDEFSDEDEDFEWHCSAYAIEHKDGYDSVNTDHCKFLFTYKNGKINFHDQHNEANEFPRR